MPICQYGQRLQACNVPFLPILLRDEPIKNKGLDIHLTPYLIGAVERSRTSDLLITNQLLYQLSYNSPQENG